MMCIVVVGIVTISQTSQDRDNWFIGHHQQAGVGGGLQGGSAPHLRQIGRGGGIDKEVYNRKDEGLVIRDLVFFLVLK